MIVFLPQNKFTWAVAGIGLGLVAVGLVLNAREAIQGYRDVKAAKKTTQAMKDRLAAGDLDGVSDLADQADVAHRQRTDARAARQSSNANLFDLAAGVISL